MRGTGVLWKGAGFLWEGCRGFVGRVPGFCGKGAGALWEGCRVLWELGSARRMETEGLLAACANASNTAGAPAAPFARQSRSPTSRLKPYERSGSPTSRPKRRGLRALLGGAGVCGSWALPGEWRLKGSWRHAPTLATPPGRLRRHSSRCRTVVRADLLPVASSFVNA